MALRIALLFFSFFHLILANGQTAPKLKRVAIIFNGGDPEKNGNMDQQFDKKQREAATFYKTAGYDQVIVLSRHAADADLRSTESNFVREMSNLKDVGELQLYLIGHGDSWPEVAAEKKPFTQAEFSKSPDPTLALSFVKESIERRNKFSSVPITPHESKIVAEKAGREASFDQVTFGLITTEGDEKSSIGLGELKKALEVAAKKILNW